MPTHLHIGAEQVPCELDIGAEQTECVVPNGPDGVSACAGSSSTQLWALSANRLIGRVQAAASRDFLVDADLTTGDALPDWVYSTGFDLTPSPSVVKGLLIDADGPVKVTTAKTVLGTVPAQAREFDVTVPTDADERWIPAASDFDAMKFRLEFTGSPSVELRRAMFERDLISKKGG